MSEICASYSCAHKTVSNPCYFLENGKSKKQRLPPPPPVPIPYETSHLDNEANEEENTETDVLEEEQGLYHFNIKLAKAKTNFRKIKNSVIHFY